MRKTNLKQNIFMKKRILFKKGQFYLFVPFERHLLTRNPDQNRSSFLVEVNTFVQVEVR